MTRLIKNLFVKNWGLKLFSFLLAVVLWFAFIPEEKTFSEFILAVPLELHNIPLGLEVVEKPTSTVDVKIRAPKRTINEITSANVHAVLNLQEARVEDREFPLNKNMISIPEGAEVKDFYPSQVNLRLETIKEILLDVEPVLTGELKEELKLIKIEVTPPQVLVRGPESKVKDDYKVRTSPIDRSTLEQSIEIEADLILPNPDLKLALPGTKVKVKLIIEEKNPEKKEEKEENRK